MEQLNLEQLKSLSDDMKRARSWFDEMVGFMEKMENLDQITTTKTRFKLKTETWRLLTKTLSNINKKRKKQGVKPLFKKDIAEKIGISEKALRENIKWKTTMDWKNLGFLITTTWLKLDDILENVIVEMPYKSLKSQMPWNASDEDILHAIENINEW